MPNLSKIMVDSLDRNERARIKRERAKRHADRKRKNVTANDLKTD